MQQEENLLLYFFLVTCVNQKALRAGCYEFTCAQISCKIYVYFGKIKTAVVSFSAAVKEDGDGSI